MNAYKKIERLAEEYWANLKSQYSEGEILKIKYENGKNYYIFKNLIWFFANFLKENHELELFISYLRNEHLEKKFRKELDDLEPTIFNYGLGIPPQTVDYDEWIWRGKLGKKELVAKYDEDTYERATNTILYLEADIVKDQKSILVKAILYMDQKKIIEKFKDKMLIPPFDSEFQFLVNKTKN